MSNRRDFLKQTLAPAGAICLGAAVSLPAMAHASPGSASSVLSEKMKLITRSSGWQLVDQIKVSFKTFHCQGMVRIGNEYWVSSVEMLTAPGERFDWRKGKGHLFHIDAKGNLLADIAIGEGTIYHPSGIDFDGRQIFIAAAEYRPDSQAIIYRFDPATAELQEVFRWQDHIGGILRNPDTNTLHGISWGSRRFYQWKLDASGKAKMPVGPHRDTAILNPSHYIDYQDNQYIGNGEILFTGLAAFTKPDGVKVVVGGFDIVDTRQNLPVHQVPFNLWSPVTGAVISQNPSWFEMNGEKVRAHFMPDDNDSTIYIYEGGY